MKFSWKLLNQFIDLKNTKLEEFKEKLTLCGIEIEQIENNIALKDKIIYLNITSNRKEISCVANLAKEISIILNLPLKIKYINLHKAYLKNSLETIEPITEIKYLKFYSINNIKNSSSPSWLIKYLKISDIKPSNLWHNIEEYTKIKWGYTIKILTIDTLEKELLNLNIKKHNHYQTNSSNLSLIPYLKQQLFDYNNWYHECYEKILLFALNENNHWSYCDENLLNNYTYAQQDIINIITTFTGSTIGKPLEEWKTKICIESNYHIQIRKSRVHNILGCTKYKKLKSLPTKEILTTLNKLTFNPVYYKNLNIIQAKVPNNRIHDITREIDVIEEIGRIYGFNNFFNKLSLNNIKGRISPFYFQIKKTRTLLRNLGLNEVINCSLVQNNIYTNFERTIGLHNFITNEQNSLRNNIIENLINNYKYNIKHKNPRIEIFEMGKVFEQVTKNHKTETMHLGGLIYNPNFIRTNWSNKPENINWFHAKGIIETFLEQLDCKIFWNKKFQKSDTVNQAIKNILYLFHPIKRIGIYNLLNKKLIGIFGELNLKDNVSETNKKHVYIFEINTKELYKTINVKNKHLKYNIKPYSLYPSVTRDISLKIKKNHHLTEIKEIIFQTNKNLIKSINIFNEYYDQKSRVRFIGLRITYQANNRTLNSTDIKNIDDSIKNLLN